jgi:hypothetical protein
MAYIKVRYLWQAVAAALLLAAAAQAAGQSGGPYDLSWWTLDGGGSTYSTGGAYSLGGTAGQPDAGLQTGGRYALSGGFWGSSTAAMHEVFLPLVLHYH